jgi:hypothetical protein
MLLFTLNTSVGNQVSSIAKWVLGSTLSRSKKFNYKVPGFKGS